MRFRPRRVIDLCIALIFFMVIYYFFVGFSSKTKPDVKQPPFLNKMRNDIYKIQDAIGRGQFADANIDKSMNYDNSGVVRQVQPPGSFLDEYTNLDNEWGGPVMQTFTPDKLGNYEPTSIENRVGPGERGAPYHTNMADRQRADDSLRAYGFNQFASDQISLNRSIPDTRPPDCKRWQYNEHGLTASVVVVFHNEGWSTLLRTALSAINRSPPHMLKEVVLVDDFSDKSHTKGPLDQFIQNKFPDGRIKVFRNPERMGLIQSRTRGAQFASGDVVVFLDAHCEVNVNWLPPLLARIAHNRSIIAVPFVDSIQWDTFQYSAQYQGESFRGIWEWSLFYKESRVPDDEMARVMRRHGSASHPYRAPTHAGGLFAVHRQYFLELGAYDPGLRIWGGENFELSFKAWLCGGAVEWVPCSHVGHVYRHGVPYSYGQKNPLVPIVLINYVRVIDVWFDDEQKEWFYRREPQMKGYPCGNLTAQLEFKRKHQRHSFRWFLKHIATEVLEKYPAPPANVFWGQMHNEGTGLCVDTVGQGVGGGPIGLSTCHNFGGNQFWRLNVEGQWGFGERCIERVGGLAARSGVSIQYCDVQPTGPWEYLNATRQIRHRQVGLCLDGTGAQLHLVDCVGRPSQQFTFKEWRPPPPDD